MMDDMLLGDWNAEKFFSSMAMKNKLARELGFKFCRVSGLDGFEDVLQNSQNSKAFLCVSDISDGYTELNNTPRTRRVKTIFLALRHKAQDMEARNKAMSQMREVFRQFMSVLIQERVKLEQNSIYLDPRISFHEIDSFFFPSCACAYFQIAVDVFLDLRLNPECWL